MTKIIMKPEGYEICMAGFSLIAASVTALAVSLFSGFPGLLPIMLFFVLLVLNCECMAANLYIQDKTSMMFMAVITSALVVLLCGIVFSSNLNAFLCEIGLQDPEQVHPLVPVLTTVFVIVLHRQLQKRAEKNQLFVQKIGAKLTNALNERTYHPHMSRYRKMMIKEGILTERMPEDNEME